MRGVCECRRSASCSRGSAGWRSAWNALRWTPRWFVESDPFCRAVLAKDWPTVPQYGDVRTVTGAELESVDLIAGGDPCQENSRSRHMGRVRFPSLALEFLAIIAALRPRLVLRENPTATRADAPWPWWRFRAELEALGYAVLPFRLRACCLGAHHQRDRLFLLAELSDSHGHSGIESSHRDLDRAVLPEARWPASADPPRRRPGWAPEPDVARVAYGVPNRLARHRALGNAVVPQVAEWIGARLMAAWRAGDGATRR